MTAARPNRNLAVSLPAQVTTLSGVVFNARDDLWQYRDVAKTVSLDFSFMGAESVDLRSSLKMTLAWFVRHASPSYVVNLFERFKRFYEDAFLVSGRRLKTVDSAALMGYFSRLPPSKTWYVGQLAALIRKWHALGYVGVEQDVIRLLDRLTIKGNQKGEAVLAADPCHGPFTDIELGAIHVRLELAFRERRISRANYLLVSLFLLLGQRPIQYAALKLKDILVSRSEAGELNVIICVPRAKQRFQSIRENFKKRLLIPSVGEIVVEHVIDVRKKLASLFEDSDEAPLFPAHLSRRNEPTGFAYHRTSSSLILSLISVVDSLGVISERTGAPIHVAAYRFRRTVGTRAAEEGHGELVIAEMLDHSDTQNVGVYVEARRAMGDRIDRAMALRLAPLAQAFSGKLIRDESCADRSGDHSSRIRGPNVAMSDAPMGNCGSFGFCGAMAPIACYTCVSFQPWLDGPHDEVLDHLLKERERLRGAGNARISAINDRTILAVAEVVRRCDEARLVRLK
ncbi:integrase [Pandoraea horticolens]|uniref:Integrase n=1 Tax=Pandoraea horticolens TaxID=2508298 RepID=A0A5E4RA76_9BURK|nr:site-specific integrase [Pandoraea horticolens]VVD59018.1 integrase [Pandoraea horticolens]